MKKFGIRAVVTGFCVLLSVSSMLSFSACEFDSPFGILAVRERVDALRLELTENLVDALKNHDVTAAKALFCQKSQELPDLEAQIEKTFSFMEGDIQTYTPSSEIGGESYANEYGTVVSYSFHGDTMITTDAGRKYTMTFMVHYIVAGESIKGMNFYGISESDRDYEDYKRCRAGYGWSSPYDSECGILSATLITAIGRGDEEAVKNMLCAQTLEKPETEAELQTALAFFRGTPVFTERADGLYDYSDDEKDFTCNVLGYDVTEDESGNPAGIWVNVLAWWIHTDEEESYRLDFTAYLRCTEHPQWEGISYFSLENWKTEEKVRVGGWLRETDD